MSNMSSRRFQAFYLVCLAASLLILLASPCSFILQDKTTYCMSDKINDVGSLWIVGNIIGKLQ